jgi:hypothetical protein
MSHRSRKYIQGNKLTLRVVSVSLHIFFQKEKGLLTDSAEQMLVVTGDPSEATIKVAAQPPPLSDVGHAALATGRPRAFRWAGYESCGGSKPCSQYP